MGAAAIAASAAFLPAAARPETPRAAATQVEAVARDRGDAALRLATFDQVWVQIRDRYYDPHFNGTDWNAVHAKYRPRAASARSDAEFYALLRSMAGELRDAHTRVFTPAQAQSRARERIVATGIILFEVGGQPVVFDVWPNSPASEAGLRPGLRVLAVDGVPVAEALARERAEVGPSSSARASAVLAYLRLIAGPAGQALRLTLSGPDGRAFDVSLPRRDLDTTPRFESRILPSGHLYVKFDRFRAPVARLFRAAIERSPGVPGLVLDLRSNTGGDGKEGMRTVAPLLAEPTLIARLATRTGKPPSALGGLVKLPLRMMAGKAGGQAFAGPVVILTNEGTGSTSEVIAASLQERGRAKVVGSRSCGCALGVLKHRKLVNGGALAISEVGLLSGLGRRIEGAGVVPDVRAEPSLAEFERGLDPALEAAVETLRAMTDPPR
jgi:carboxyl-terminal processing protease